MSFPEVGADGFDATRQFHQFVAFAGQCAADRRPYADAEEAAEAFQGWSSGPAGIRASIKLDEVQRAAYRARQVELAREAVAVFMADNLDPDDFDIYAEEGLIDSAVLVAAGATHARDGELSTLIRPADVVDIIAAHFPITDRENAEWLAERALIDIHVPFRDPTPEEYQEVQEVAFVEAWCAAPDMLESIPPTANLAEALMERFPGLTYRDAGRAAEDALRITVGFLKNGAEEVAPTGLDLTDPANWDDPANMPERLRSSLVSATPYQWIDPAEVPTRPWVFGHWLLRGTVTALIAPGGVGKSTLTSAMALSLTTGWTLLNKTVHGGRQRAWLWNLEDARDEMQRSIQATAKHYGISSDDIAGRLFVDTAMDGNGLCTATEDRTGFKLLAPVYEAITAEIRKRQIDVLVVDPFVSSHEVEENANTKIDKIAKAWARVANDANCSVVLVHHTSKAGAGEVTAMSARGAKALTDACRSALVLNRIDDNLCPGDSVGVAVPWERPHPLEGITDEDLAAVKAVKAVIAVGEWRENVQSTDWAGRAVAEALGLDIGIPAEKKRTQHLLASWIATGDFVVVERRDKKRELRKFIEIAAPAAP